MTPAITTHGLTRRHGRQTVVDGLDLTVPALSVYGFLGPNGAGKTTTVRLLLGLLRPHGGTISLFGQPLAGRREAALRRVGALVETPALYGRLSGRDNLLVACRLRGLLAAEADRVLALVGLEDAADRPARAYSLGMRQRLGIALALLGEPELLVLDEPTNGLDPDGIREVRELLADLPARTGATVFVSSHLLSEVERVATHVGVLSAGRLLYQGPIEGLQTEPGLRVAVAASPLEAAVVALGRAGWPAHVEGGRAVWSASDEAEVALAVAALVHDGVAVYGVERSAPSLEAAFLALTTAPEGARP